MKRLLLAFFALMIGLAVNAQTITVLSPGADPGEDYMRDSVIDIVIQRSGFTGQITLQYSTTGVNGTYTTIATVNSSSTTVYSWTVPAVSSTNCYIKAFRTASSSTFGTSPEPFRIRNPQITVETPNGGEVWGQGTNQYIYWNEQDNDEVNISYSTNNGASWSTVATAVTASNAAYYWTVPSTLSTQCKVAISNSNYPQFADTSDANFTINGPTVTVVAPNGGEMLTGNQNYNITWTSTGLSAYVNLYYSLNNGGSWTLINWANNSNGGSYNWTVPNVNTVNALIKVEDYYTPSYADQSNSTFEINITLPSCATGMVPSNGATAQSINTTLSWSSVSTATSYDVYFDTVSNPGFVINVGTTYYTPGTLNINETYYWKVVPKNAGGAAIGCSTYSFSTSSTADFFMNDNNPVTTCTGNFYDSGGPLGQYGNSQDFQKTFYPGTAGQYVRLSFNTFASESGYDYLYIYDDTIASNQLAVYNGNSTPGIFTASNSSGALTVRWHTDGSVINNGWEATISCSATPAAGVVNLTSPNGGESWSAGSAYNITWTSSSVPNVNIDYSVNGGATWNVIAANISNTGSYSWTTPSALNSCNARVRVTDANDSTVTDMSAANFCIQQPYVTITTPSGGENWTGGTGNYIYYNQTGISYVNAYYSTDSVNWTYINVYSTTGSIYWTTPSNITSCTVYIKLQDYYDTSHVDVSNAFCLTAPAPSITVTAPNGGQTWIAGASNQYISWTAANTSNNFSLYYSTDNGVTWQFIDDNITNNYYYWTAPAVSSCSVLVKVEDGAAPSVNDVSNATFCIVIPDFTLTSPNGGESWTAGTNQNITWTSSNASAYVTLDYSINGGTSWTTIATPSNNGSYSWSVPNNPSCNSVVRVTDYYSNTYGDTSNANFCINGPTPTLTLTTPNGGQTWSNATSQYIYWNSSSISNVKLEYSANNGTTWNTIIASTTASSGYYYWNLNGLSAGCNYLVRVSDATNSSLNDVSNSTFCIVQPVITVTSPNGGQNYVAGTYQNITWTSSNASSYVNIYYSTNGGSTWTTITNGDYNDGTYSWYVPFNAGCNYTVKVEDYYYNSIFDVSDANYCVALPTPAITVNYPNGGESFVANTSTNITWNSVSVSAVNIDYSSDGGTTWTNLITNYATNNNYYNGSYYWNLSGALATCSYKVRVTATANAAVTDMSNNTFCIIPPYITVNAPNGGEVWGIGSSHYITWNAPGVSLVDIELSTNGGVSFSTVLATGVSASANYFYWTIPANTTPSTQCLVRVKDSNNPTTILDVSNNYFTIPPPSITLTTPNGGQNYGIGTGQYIYWSSTSVANVNLAYSVDSGATWTAIANNVNASNGYYYWTIPNSPSNEVLVSVTDASNSSLSDVSSSVFTIITPVINITAPNGGESWMGTTTHAITWNSTGLSSYVNLQYSLNNGTSWNGIVNGIYNSGSYSWYVPNTPSTQCLVRVIDYSYNTYGDTSNATFTIVAPTPAITVTAPNGGQVWGVGSTQYIYWNSISVSTVDIEYSVNNGATWSLVDDNINASNGYYAWVIPNTPSSNCLVKVYDSSNNTVVDSSNAVFTIPVPSITLTSPNGGEVWGAGSTQYIYWNAVSIPSVKIEYSTNNGVIWNTIVNSTNGYNGYYAWTIPAVSSAQCKVRVSSVSNSAIVDASNANFTIAIPTINVTFPNNGAQLVGFTYKPINWTSTGTSSYVNIQYSTDNGVNWLYVATGIYNTGTYNWYVPNTPTTQAIVRVSDYYNGNTFGNSTGNFTINAANPSISVSYPNGGENFLAGNSYNIYWSAVAIQNVKIEYTSDNGVNWNLISASTPASNGSYYWSVPNVVSNLYKVRVSDASNTSLSDVSNNTFSVSQPIPSLSLTSPDGGENWTIGGYNYITWNANNISGVNVSLSYDNGASWTSVVNNATGNYYYYNVVGPVSSQCLVKVVASNNAALVDSSASTFSIDSVITNNNTLVVDTLSRFAYCKGDSISVPFTASGVFNAGNTYTIQLSDSSGSFANPIAVGSLSSVLTTGNIAGTLPTNILNGINYKVRVVASDLNTIGTAYQYPIVINSPEFDFTPASQLRKYLPDGTVNFTYDGDTTGVVSYKWQFGNGDTAVTANATYNYDQIGFYTVTLEATSNAGCKTTVTKYDLIDVEQIFPSIDLGNIGSGNNLNSVAPSVTGDTLFAVGNNGTIIMSINGGTSWNNVPGVPAADYSAVTLAGGASTGTYICVSGNNGYVAFSNNGGQTWNQVSNAATGSSNYNGVYFSTFDNGFAVGENGSIVHYNGSVWTNQSSLVNNTSVVFNAVSTSGVNNAMAVGNSGVIYTYNGSAWTAINTNITTDLHAVYHSTGTTWYASGDNGLIIKSVDDGATWTTEFSGIASSFKSIAADPVNDIVWAVGENGVVYQKTATQVTFERYSIGNTSNQRGASYKSGKGVIVGDSGVGYRFGKTDVAVGDLGDTLFCAGSVINIPLQVSGQFNLGNVFTAQLSDATGNFATPTVLGSVSTNVEDTIVATIPASTPSGSAYRIRIISTDTALVGNDNGVNLYINAAPVVDLGSDLAPCANDTIMLDALNAGSTFSWSNDSLTQSIPVTASGTYTVTVTNGSGCSTSDSVSVNYINSQFNIDLGSDIASCNVSGVSLDAGIAGLSYSWNTGDTTQVISIDTAGTYIVTASKCSFTDSDTIVVEIGTPAIVNLGNDTTICSGASFVLTTPFVNGYSYLWNDLSTNDSLTVTATGVYTISVTTPAGCVTIDTVNVTPGALPVFSLGADTTLCIGSSLTLNAPVATGYNYLWNDSSTANNLSANAGGTYSVTVTTAAMCAYSDAIVITNAALPVVNLGNDTSLCGSLVLTAPAGNTYLWSNNATTQSITANTAGTNTYSVTVTSAAGCTASDTITVTIQSGAGSAPVITQTNNTMTCNATGATSYQWYYNGVALTGATSQTYTTTVAGVYTVTINGGVGCNSTSAQYIFNPTGISNIGSDGVSMTVTPNPTSGKFTLGFESANAQNVMIIVTDVLGRETYTENMVNFAGKYNKAIDITDFASGVYTVNVIMDKTSFVQKVVLQK